MHTPLEQSHRDREIYFTYEWNELKSDHTYTVSNRIRFILH